MKRKILIVSPRAFGYIDHIVKTLKKQHSIELTVVYLEYSGYRNNKEKVVNFLSKTANVFLDTRSIFVVSKPINLGDISIASSNFFCDKTVFILAFNAEKAANVFSTCSFISVVLIAGIKVISASLSASLKSTLMRALKEGELKIVGLMPSFKLVTRLFNSSALLKASLGEV